MMLVPRKNDFDFIDDFFDNSLLKNSNNSKIMKTDIKEHDNHYQLDIELPGFNKENINISIEDGYLTINAKTSSDKEENEKGKYVHRERFSGEYSRSFYVGDAIIEEDIKATFKNGMLTLTVPKKEEIEKTTKKYISIDD